MLTPTRPNLALTIVSALGRSLLPSRRALAILLALLLYTQAIVSPAFASARASLPDDKAASGRIASRRASGSLSQPAAALPEPETFGVVLTALSTVFNNHTGIDYHQQSRNLVVSANAPSGQPNNFELIDGGGTHYAFSNTSSLGGALKIATARDDGQGASLGGFRAGELFTGTGVAGVVGRVAPDGALMQNPWVTLPGEAGLPGGLHVDRTGVFGGNLIVVTDAGGVWRINAEGTAALLASLNTPLSGVTTIPDDAARYGPWAGKILAGAKEQGTVYAIDTQGGATAYPLGVNPEDISVIPAHENFFGLDPVEAKLWGAPADAFTGIIGDVLVAQKSPGILTRVRWNGTGFETAHIAQVASWGQITFAPAGVAEMRGAKQVYDKIAVVRHAPVLNSGRVEGALWQLSAEDITLDGTDEITSDLLVPGTPAVNASSPSTFGGVIEGVEDSQPAGYSVSISGNAALRHLITRTNPFELETVAAPPTPSGTNDVSITKEGQGVVDFSTVRDLSLSGKAGAVSVPPGTYGSFSASGRTTLVLGIENATEPAVYNLQSLSLSGGSELRLRGPVALTVKGDVSLTGSTVGAADRPRHLLLKLAEGAVKVGGGGVLYGVVRAPQSTVEITGRGRLRGTVLCDRLIVGGNGVLQVTENDIAPPPINRPPAVNAGHDQSLTLPSDTVSLNGTVSDDGLPQGSILSVNWVVTSGPGPVSFGSPTSAATTAVFAEPGIYVLKLTASDGQLTRSDSVQVEVLRRNQPPTASAGTDQTIKLSDSANLNGAVTDDGLPAGVALTSTWTKLSGPGEVAFANAGSAVTTASFTQPGTYVLRLTANDTEFSSVDEVTIVVEPSSSPGRVYTLNADFDEGSYINVTHAVPDQLQLDETARTLNFIWVAVSSKGTVVKIDTETGAVLGEYFTSPNGQPRNPSRTTVDQNGNVWATNRDGNSVLHIGLVENGQCVDRNRNGRIDTSNGYGNILAWTNAGGADSNGGVSTAQDECIIHYTKVNTSGTRHVSVTTENDVWVSGTGGQRFDLVDGKTGLVKRSEPSVGYGGYGGLIDKNGVIWSARYLLRWDTSKPLTGPNGGNWQGYHHDSYGLCIDSKGNVWNTSLGGNLIYKFAPDGTQLGTFNHGAYYAQGCVVDKNDDVWVAHSLYDSSVGHLKSNGVFVGNVAVGSGPTGVAVDAKGKIWATNHNSWTVSRIDPKLGPVGADGVTPVGQVDLTTRELGGNLYNYSDMTGSTLSGAPNQGTWSTIFDSQVAGAQWGRIGWTAKVCGDGLLTISVSTGEDGTTFSQPVSVSNGDDPEVPAGRYVKVTVRFERATSGESPVLYDLSIGTANFALETPSNLAPEVDAGIDQTLNGVTKTTLRGAACDDGLPSNRRLALSWSKVSGPGAVTFAQPNSPATEVTFGVPGTYELKLTASDSALTRGDTVLVEVLPGNEPPSVKAGPDLAVTHPDAATLNGTVTDDGLPRGGTLLATWSKVSGPGGVTFADPKAASTTARFGAPGSYVLKLTASDTELAAQDEVTVTVGGENQSPVVNAGPDRTITLPNTASLNGTATDDGWPEGSSLTVSWSVVSGPGTGTFNNPNSPATTASFSVDGTYVLRLTASDSEFTASDEVTVTAGPAVPLPVVAITSPADGSRLYDRTEITGSVSAGPWRLEYSLNSPEGAAGRVWTTFASGNAPAEGLLGTFDPTLLLNGSYRVRLVAANASGQTSEANFSATVAGELKVGLFTVTFTDLGVDVAGIPIEVSRIYDSRDKRTGDFGAGWSLGLRNVRVEKSSSLGNDWEQTSTGGLFPTYCLRQTRPSTVTVTFPNGTVYDFRTSVAPQCQSFAPVQYTSVGFTQLPGDATTQGATLTALDYGNDVFFTGPAPGSGELLSDETMDLYEPTRFRLTTADGVDYVIDEKAGLQSIRDTNGNTLTVNPGGIIHSSGKSVTFTRDAQNRITRITDPAGNHLDYAYDPAGDLTSVTDQDGRTTRYTYNSSHGLLDIIDPLNRRGVRNEYDASGRLTSITDEAGKSIRFEFDPSSRQQVVTDRKGNVTVYEYDGRGNALSITDARGKVVRSTYDQAGNRLTDTDQFGNTTTFTYDVRGNVLTRTDAQGRVTRFTYNARNQVTSVTDANGNAMASSYDSNGNLISATDPLGNTINFTYSTGGELLTYKDAAGRVASFEYNAFGNMTKATDRLGHATRFTYDAMGKRVSVTDSKGSTTQFNFDAAGLPTTTVDALGNITRNEYDVAGNLSASVDALGNRTEITNNFRGMPLQMTNPDGTQFGVRYDANGQVEGSTTTGGLAPTLERDVINLPTKVNIAPGISLSYQYDAAGRKSAESDPLGNTATYQYNLSNQVTVQTDPLGKQTHLSYDAVGNLVSRTDPNGNATTFTYDKANRRVRTTLPDGSVYENTYDALGQVTAQRDALGNASTFTYDAEGNLLTVTQPGGAVTRYEYDSNGNMISATDANGRKTVFEYDKLNRLVKKTFPDATTELTVYNGLGMVSSKTDRRGNTTTFEYDNMSRVSLIRYTGGGTVAYTYTSTGKRDTVTDERGVTDFSYDAMERVTRVRYPDGTIIAYAYDNAGNRTGITTPDGTTRYGYDQGNRLVRVTDPRGLVTTYSYDAAGNVVGVSHPNGLVTSKTYDRTNQLSSIKTTNPNGDTIMQETYTRDANGRRTKIVQADGSSVEYAYDAQSRLTSEAYKDSGGNLWRQTGYTYDAVGNRLAMTDAGTQTTVTYTYNGNDQLISDGAHAFAYDAAGNTLSKTVSGSATSYAYDVRNRLTQVTRPDGSTISYNYDDAGNRVRSTDAGGSVTNHIVDPTGGAAKVVVETDGDGRVVASYTYGLELISQRRNGADSFYLHDALGSTRALTDSSGAVTDNYSYDAFGRLTAGGGATVNSFLYTGEQNDAATELYYLRARYYDPSIGRFLSMDPYEGNISDPPTQHRYAYTQNNPVNATDPTGMATQKEGRDIHRILGFYYIAQWGDYFVSTLLRKRNMAKGFHLMKYLENGKGAYDRAVRSIKTDKAVKVDGGQDRPDLRNYEYGEVYEIKPFPDVAEALRKVRLYTAALNQHEKGQGVPENGEWERGTSQTFPPIVSFPYAGQTVDVFSFPFTPAGTILYTFRMPQPSPREPFDPDLSVEFNLIAMSRFLMLAGSAGSGSIGGAAGTAAVGARVMFVSAPAQSKVVMARIGTAITNSMMIKH